MSLGILTSCKSKNETTEDSSDSESEDDMTPCTPLQAALHRKRLAEKKKKKATSSNAPGADSLEEVLTKRLREYLNQDFDPEHELRMQCKGMGKIQTTLTGRE